MKNKYTIICFKETYKHELKQHIERLKQQHENAWSKHVLNPQVNSSNHQTTEIKRSNTP